MLYAINQLGKEPSLGEENLSINRKREMQMQALTRAKSLRAQEELMKPMSYKDYGCGKGFK